MRFPRETRGRHRQSAYVSAGLAESAAGYLDRLQVAYASGAGRSRVAPYAHDGHGFSTSFSKDSTVEKPQTQRTQRTSSSASSA
jgi:hypothetical protein